MSAPGVEPPDAPRCGGRGEWGGGPSSRTPALRRSRRVGLSAEPSDAPRCGGRGEWSCGPSFWTPRVVVGAVSGVVAKLLDALRCAGRGCWQIARTTRVAVRVLGAASGVAIGGPALRWARWVALGERVSGRPRCGGRLRSVVHEPVGGPRCGGRGGLGCGANLLRKPALRRVGDATSAAAGRSPGSPRLRRVRLRAEPAEFPAAMSLTAWLSHQ
jgi:hypothetical protein